MRPKFCGKLLKAPKAKAKVDKIHQNRMKSKYYTMHCMGKIACIRSIDMGLTSAAGQELECFK
jgi:hypothetical protein